MCATPCVRCAASPAAPPAAATAVPAAAPAPAPAACACARERAREPAPAPRARACAAACSVRATTLARSCACERQAAVRVPSARALWRARRADTAARAEATPPIPRLACRVTHTTTVRQHASNPDGRARLRGLLVAARRGRPGARHQNARPKAATFRLTSARPSSRGRRARVTVGEQRRGRVGKAVRFDVGARARARRRRPTIRPVRAGGARARARDPCRTDWAADPDPNRRIRAARTTNRNAAAPSKRTRPRRPASPQQATQPKEKASRSSGVLNPDITLNTQPYSNYACTYVPSVRPD